ncbi:hypothetical protein [Vitiosangium sp. GDMCC 1.1324]|nr:hypothetical protein [Vitiosangium sp. GDMCC 1.1324]
MLRRAHLKTEKLSGEVYACFGGLGKQDTRWILDRVSLDGRCDGPPAGR